MSKAIITEGYLTDIADAIRSVNGETATYKPSEMAAKIKALSAAGVKVETIGSGTIDNGYYSDSDHTSALDYETLLGMVTGSGGIIYHWLQAYYTVTLYDADGSVLSTTQVVPGKSYTVATTTESKSGYTFDGWNTAAAGTGTAYAVGATITATDGGSITLYPVWRKNFVLTYYKTDGTVLSTTELAPGKTATVAATTETRSGYQFTAWNTASGGTGTAYKAGATVTATEGGTLSLYPQWQRLYTITYNANNGSGAPSSQTTTGTVTLSSTAPTRSGYKFLGWATSSGATTAQYKAGASITVTADMTLYAVWEVSTIVATAFSSMSDADLLTMFQSGDYDLSAWKVGDTRSVTLTGDQAGTYTMVIMDATPYDVVSGTKAKYIWGLKECLKSPHVMNPSNTNSGGWDSTSMRSYLNSDVYNMLPAWLKTATKKVKVIDDKGYDVSGTNTSQDYLFIPNEWEVFGSSDVGYSGYGYAYENSAVENASHQWTWYKTANNRVKTIDGSDDYWWERSSTGGNSYGFCRVLSVGSPSTYNAGYSFGVALSGCI